MSRARKKKEEMSGISLGVLSSGALAGAERSEGDRSEPQRSGVAAKAVADSMPASRPDSEVVAKAIESFKHSWALLTAVFSDQSVV
jgi:hypothetical protein